MKPFHMNAQKDQVADIVLMPGDPLRAKYIADKYLINAE
jgi:purine-nucleoside phosphorylase